MNCSGVEYVYIPSDCLALPDIEVKDSDKVALKKHQDEFSFEFIESLNTQKTIRKQKCSK